MSFPENETPVTAVEPLLPIEKKLIAWSLGIGVVSLAILVILNHFVPIAV